MEWVKFNDEFVMSINLSYVQLTEPGFIPFMKSAIDEKNGLSTENVVVELTESYMAKGTNSVKEIFDRIRELGFKIAMDDFGTGYSSLDILKNSPADIVKIDKTFIKDIMTSNFDATFIKFIVELCHDVDISVCLEGVERLEEYNIVKTMNLDMIQTFSSGGQSHLKSSKGNFSIQIYVEDIRHPLDPSGLSLSAQGDIWGCLLLSTDNYKWKHCQY